jgi:hypothetical protein
MVFSDFTSTYLNANTSTASKATQLVHPTVTAEALVEFYAKHDPSKANTSFAAGLLKSLTQSDLQQRIEAKYAVLPVLVEGKANIAPVLRKGTLFKLSTKKVWQRREFVLDQNGQLKCNSRQIQLKAYQSVWSEGQFIHLESQDNKNFKLKARSEEKAADWVGDMTAFLGDIILVEEHNSEIRETMYSDADADAKIDLLAELKRTVKVAELDASARIPMLAELKLTVKVAEHPSEVDHNSEIRQTMYSDADADAKIDMLAELKQTVKVVESRGVVSAFKEDLRREQQRAQGSSQSAAEQSKRSADNFETTRSEGKWVSVPLLEAEVDLAMYDTDDEEGGWASGHAATPAIDFADI